MLLNKKFQYLYLIIIILLISFSLFQYITFQNNIYDINLKVIHLQDSLKNQNTKIKKLINEIDYIDIRLDDLEITVDDIDRFTSSYNFLTE